MKLLTDYSLRHLNTFRIDVKAKLFSEIFSFEQMLEILADRKTANEKKFLLGGGSNILFTKDFDGLVIKNSIPGIKVIDEDNKYVFIEAGAGLIWDELVEYCTEKNYGGIENLSFIPGTVGAAPVQNIGAYGQELSDSFHSLDGIFIESSQTKIFQPDECFFSYRSSIFKEELNNKFAITSVKLKLQKFPVVNYSYPEIQKYIEEHRISSPSLRDMRKAVIQIRKQKLPDPELIGNAGSYFKNPVVTKEQFEIIKQKFNDVIAFGLSNGLYKIAAGWLIEKCGWKGKRIGDAGVFRNHALILVNYNNASAAEIVELAVKIKKDVGEVFGIKLEEEINII
jgi:UDP-N-acetylmuramate dehydrogenase